MPYKKYLDLTQHEIEALKNEYNLADAHTHQKPSRLQRKIIRRLPKLWYESCDLKQHELDERFVQSFFTYHKQSTALKTPSLLVYAASISMVIVANYFKKHKFSVSLITPCFDNLPDLLNLQEVKLEPIEESLFHDVDKIYENLSKNLKTDVLFLVSPNNPTGWELTGHAHEEYKKGFEEVTRFCKDHKKILVFDFCFAAFIINDERVPTFDVYELLENSGVTYITIEDVGKTWPLRDAKASIIKTSADIFAEVRDVHSAYLLNVSPFILNTVSAFIESSKKDKGRSVSDLLKKNKDIAKNILNGSVLKFIEPKVDVSVAWFEITNDHYTATQLQELIYKYGKVYVLPGTYFFWNDRSKGEKYLRLALARDTKLFKAALKQLRATLDKLYA